MKCTLPCHHSKPCARLSATRSMQALSNEEGPHKITVTDVSRACVYARRIRPLHMEFVLENCLLEKEGLRVLLQCSMYWTRYAASHWHETYRQHLLDLGFMHGCCPRGIITCDTSSSCWEKIFFGNGDMSHSMPSQ